MMPKSITVFFPCYNDAESIRQLVIDAQKVLSTSVKDWEILVIDDGSTDDSCTVLKLMAKNIRNFRIIRHAKNLGYGAALRRGFKESKKEFIFYTDGDGQYDVKELRILLPLISNDADFINGIKIARHDPTYRIVIGNCYGFIARWLFWLPIYDVDCDFRLIRRSLVNKLHLTSNNGSICVELVKKAQIAGARFRQVSIHHYERKYGRSQFFRIDRIFMTLIEIGKLWMQLIVLRI